MRSRGKRLVVIVGQKAPAIAIKIRQTRRKWSKLRKWLKDAMMPGYPTLGSSVERGSDRSLRYVDDPPKKAVPALRQIPDMTAYDGRELRAALP